jgi:glycosyltransferase involved in cell wall biosynthesis
VIEALACGIPVVATAVGGIPEQIDDGLTGLLVPASDAYNLAKCIVKLLKDTALKQRMGTAAAAAAREHFDLLRQVNTYLHWFGELFDHRASEHVVERAMHALSEPGSTPTPSTR